MELSKKERESIFRNLSVLDVSDSYNFMFRIYDSGFVDITFVEDYRITDRFLRKIRYGIGLELYSVYFESYTLVFKYVGFEENE